MIVRCWEIVFLFIVSVVRQVRQLCVIRDHACNWNNYYTDNVNEIAYGFFMAGKGN